MKKAFTLIELIFVIVLLSIISMFGADLYVKIYNSYTNNRATSDLEGETERTLNIITSLLRDRVKQTVIGRATDNGEHPDGVFVYLDQVQEEHDVLEWIGKSTETQYIGSTKGLLGWSGFDIKMAVPSGDFVIQSPGSSLKDANNILTSLNAGTKSFGIIFNDDRRPDANSFGYDHKTYNHTNIGTVSITGNDTMQISGLTSKNKNRYFLVHTAYAIEPVLDNNAANVSVSVDGGTDDKIQYAKFLKIKSNFDSFNKPNRNQKLVQISIVEIQNFLMQYPDTKYKPLLETMLIKFRLAENELNKSIKNLYEKTGRDESAQIYKERIETSPVAGTDTIKPESPWYRVIFE